MARVPKELAVRVETLQMSGTSPWEGCTQNLSTEGLSMAVGRRFEPGTPVSITFDEGTAVPLTALAKVMWVEPGRGGWLHGCQFAKPVDDEEFRHLLTEAHKDPPPAPEPVEPTETPTTDSQRLNLAAIREKLRRLGQ
jgi:hypothetical protein